MTDTNKPALLTCPRCGESVLKHRPHDSSNCSMRYAPAIMEWIELPAELVKRMVKP